MSDMVVVEMAKSRKDEQLKWFGAQEYLEKLYKDGGATKRQEVEINGFLAPRYLVPMYRIKDNGVLEPYEGVLERIKDYKDPSSYEIDGHSSGYWYEPWPWWMRNINEFLWSRGQNHVNSERNHVEDVLNSLFRHIYEPKQEGISLMTEVEYIPPYFPRFMESLSSDVVDGREAYYYNAYHYSYPYLLKVSVEISKEEHDMLRMYYNIMPQSRHIRFIPRVEPKPLQNRQEIIDTMKRIRGDANKKAREFLNGLIDGDDWYLKNIARGFIASVSNKEKHEAPPAS